MEISISQPSLLAALNVAQSVADRKGNASQPILANVLLRAAKDGNLIVSASDLHISTTEYVSAEVVKTGAITLGAKYLHSVVKNASAIGDAKPRSAGQSLACCALRKA